MAMNYEFMQIQTKAEMQAWSGRPPSAGMCGWQICSTLTCFMTVLVPLPKKHQTIRHETLSSKGQSSTRPKLIFCEIPW